MSQCSSKYYSSQQELQTLSGGFIQMPEVRRWVEELESGAPLEKSEYAKEGVDTKSAKSGGGGGKASAASEKMDMDPTRDGGEFSRENVMRAIRARKQASKNNKGVEVVRNMSDQRVQETFDSIALMAADNYLMAAYKVWQSWPGTQRISKNQVIDAEIKNQYSKMFSNDGRSFGLDEETETLLKRQEEELGRSQSFNEEYLQAAQREIQMARAKLASNTENYTLEIQILGEQLEEKLRLERDLRGALASAQRDLQNFEQQESLLRDAQNQVESLQQSFAAEQSALRSLQKAAETASRLQASERLQTGELLREKDNQTNALLSAKEQEKAEAIYFAQISEQKLSEILDLHDKVKAEKEFLSRENAANSSRILMLTEELRELPLLQERVERLQGELQKSTAINSQFAQRIGDFQRNFEETQKALQKCETDAKETLARMKVLDYALQQTQARLQDSETRLQQSEALMRESENQIRRETAEIQTRLQLQEQREASFRAQASQESEQMQREFASSLQALTQQKEEMSAEAARASAELVSLPTLRYQLSNSEEEIARLKNILTEKIEKEGTGDMERSSLLSQVEAAQRALMAAQELNTTLRERLSVMEEHNRRLISSLLGVRKWISTDTPDAVSKKIIGVSLILGIVDRTLGSRLAAPTPAEHVKQLLAYISAIKEEIIEVLPQNERLVESLSGELSEQQQTFQTLQAQALAQEPKNQANASYLPLNI